MSTNQVPDAVETSPAANSAEPAQPKVETGTKRGTVTTTQPSRLQSAIARRMAEVRATVPTWTASVDVDVHELQSELIDAVIKTAAVALSEHPRVNGAWRDGKLEQYSQPNLAIAVDVDGDSILLPVIHAANEAEISQITKQRTELIAAVAAGTLRAPDSAAPTFAVIDGGPDGPDRFDSIMPPGVGASLAVGRPSLQARVVGEQVLPRNTVSLTLTADHRAIYPSHGGPFLRGLADLLAATR